jgi:hypothetical protein
MHLDERQSSHTALHMPGVIGSPPSLPKRHRTGRRAGVA